MQKCSSTEFRLVFPDNCADEALISAPKGRLEQRGNTKQKVFVCPVKPTAELWGVMMCCTDNYAAQVVVQFDYQQANFSARKKDLHWTAGFKRDSSWIWKRNQMNPSWMSLQCFHAMSGKWIPDWRYSRVWETSGALDRNTANMTAETLGANSWLAGDLVQRLHYCGWCLGSGSERGWGAWSFARSSESSWHRKEPAEVARPFD